MFENRPRPRLPVPITTITYDLRSGRVLPSAGQDARGDTGPADRPPGALQYARSASGARAWTQQTDPALFIGVAGLHVQAHGVELSCPAEVCSSGVGGVWWRGSGDLLFLRSAGSQGGGGDALYHWNVDHEPAPRLLLETDDALSGCQVAGDQLYCAAEGARAPRRIDAVDLRTGTRRTIYDPNPDFPVARLGAVSRLRWRIDAQSATYADLVLPPDHRAGDRHPLIVVQYDSRGFLRGGTGDEVPIFLLAARGYAVLSFQQPTFLPSALRAHDFATFQHANMDDFAGRKFLVAALQGGIDAAIALGVVDADQIGLTGLSDGAITAQFLLAHRNRFKAAALSTCCDDPSTAMFSAGLNYRDMVLASGYPAPGKDKTGFWTNYSIAVNAADMRTPLLLQIPDREYRLALESYNSLQLAGGPVDMYVFGDERHIKWHPTHKFAVYRRVIAWFDFWLRDRHASDLVDAVELARWDALKVAMAKAP
jgi:dipeptidyl aminopeptidase/acylaminoacyl peptidase